MKLGAVENRETGAEVRGEFPQDAKAILREFLQTTDLRDFDGLDIKSDPVCILRRAQGPKPGVAFEDAKKTFDEQVAGREITVDHVRCALSDIRDGFKRAELTKTLAMFLGSVVKSAAEQLLFAPTDRERLMGAAALLYCDEGQGTKKCLALYERLTSTKPKCLTVAPGQILNCLVEYLTLHPSDRVQTLLTNLRVQEELSKSNATRRYT